MASRLPHLSLSCLCLAMFAVAVPTLAQPQTPVAGALSDKSDLLRQAAEYLAAAGKTELAGELSREADVLEKEVILNRKLDELKKLHDEIDELRRFIGCDRQILIQMTIMELNRTQLRKLGVDFKFESGQVIQWESAQGIAKIYQGDPSVEHLLNALTEKKMLKVLSRPALMTLVGQEATIQCGGEIPILNRVEEGTVTVDTCEFGTKIECVPTILDNGKIHLEIRPTVSRFATAGLTTRGGEQKLPQLSIQRAELSAEVEPDKTVFIWGPSISDDRGETELVISLTASLADAPLSAPLKPVPVNPASAIPAPPARY